MSKPRPGSEGYWSALAEDHGAVSRLSKTNRADGQNGRHGPSRGRTLAQPLTRRDGVTLRTEVRDYYDISGDRPRSWEGTLEAWRAYIEDKRGVKTVFENGAGERAAGSKPHRFHPDYADKQYAKLKDLERGISEAYGRRLHTGMLTFTASSRPDGEPLPPVDHLDGLLESWDPVRRALDRALDGRRYERLAILEPHKSGYLHIHLAVFVDGVVSRETFAPVIEAHVRNCDLAKPEAHAVDDDSTISVRHAGRDRDLDDDDALDELAIYLAAYLGTYGDDPLEAPEHVQMANTVLWATGRQRWRPSNGAQQYMATEPREADSEWRLVGIEKGEEFYPAEAGSGGVSTFVTSTDCGPPEPPPSV